MPADVKLNVYLAPLAYGPDRFSLMLEHARLVDELGLDALDISSHVVLTPEDGSMAHARYRSFSDLRRLRETYPADNPMLHPPRNAPWLEVMSTMGAFAGATSRVELITAVALPVLYPAPLFAKAASTLDQLSGGRLRLGVANPPFEGEYRVLGVDFERRGQILDDTIAACRALWDHGAGDEPTSFSSATVSFEDVFFEPKPISADGIPIYFGGPFNKRTLRRVATGGDGWFPWLEPIERFPESVAAIKEAAAAAGRDPERLVFQLPLPAIGGDGKPAPMWTQADLDRSFERLPEVLAAGANMIILPPHNFYEEPGQGAATLERIAELWRQVVPG